MPLLRQTSAAPPPPQAGLGEKGEQDVETKVLRVLREFIILYVVKLLFGDAVDATEKLLIYSAKPAILERTETRV